MIEEANCTAEQNSERGAFHCFSSSVTAVPHPWGGIWQSALSRLAPAVPVYEDEHPIIHMNLKIIIIIYVTAKSIFPRD